MDPRIKAILNKRKPLKRSSLPKGADDVQAGPSSAEAAVAVTSGDGGARSKQQKAVDNKKKKQQEFASLKAKLQEKLELAAASAAAAAAKQEQQALQAAANLSGAADGEEKKGGKGRKKNKPTNKTQKNKNYRINQITDNKNKKDDDKKDDYEKKAEDGKQDKKLEGELERSRRQVLENFRLGLLPHLSEGDKEELFGAPSPKEPSGRQDSEVKNPPKPSKVAVAKVIPEKTVDRHPANPMAYTSELHYIDSKTGKLIPTKMAKMGYEDRRRIYADFLVPKLMLIHPALYDEIMGKMYLMPDDQVVQMIYSDYLLGRFASACIVELQKINYRLKKRNGTADCKKKKKKK